MEGTKRKWKNLNRIIGFKIGLVQYGVREKIERNLAYSRIPKSLKSKAYKN